MRAVLLAQRGDQMLVENVIIIDENYTPPDGLTLQMVGSEERVAAGWFLEGGEFHPPAPPPAANLPTADVMDLQTLAARVQAQQLVLDLLLLGGLDDGGGTVDDVIGADLPDSGGTLDDLEGLDLGTLPDSGESLDDLDLASLEG